MTPRALKKWKRRVLAAVIDRLLREAIDCLRRGDQRGLVDAFEHEARLVMQLEDRVRRQR